MKYYFVMVVLAAIGLGACGSSPPTQYYTLNSIASVGQSSTYARAGTPVTIEKVIIPASLDRPQIVRRVSPNRVDIDETERWPAPLDNMVQRVLTQDLASRMASGMVIEPGEPLPASAVRRVVVDIITFEGDLSGRVVLRAEWVATNPDGGRLSRNEYIIINAGADNAEALAAGMSQALAQLADRMATTLNQPDFVSKRDAGPKSET